MHWMTPDEDLQIFLQTPEELTCNSFKWMLAFQHLYVCLCSSCFPAFLHPLNCRCILCFCAPCSAEQPEKNKIFSNILKILVSRLVNVFLLEFMMQITWQCPASTDIMSITSLAWICIQELLHSSSPAYYWLRGKKGDLLQTKTFCITS